MIAKHPAASKQRKTGIDPGGVLISHMDAGVGVMCSLHRKLGIRVTDTISYHKSWGEHCIVGSAMCAALSVNPRTKISTVFTTILMNIVRS